VEYEITDLGRSLALLFAHLATWAAGNLDKVERARHDFATDPSRGAHSSP
jgi:DNA-binding HxlR family transcriptional regulator